MSEARTKVEIDVTHERLQELQQREPDKTPAEIAEAALEFYAINDKPWVTLDEVERYEGGE